MAGTRNEMPTYNEIEENRTMCLNNVNPDDPCPADNPFIKRLAKSSKGEARGWKRYSWRGRLESPAFGTPLPGPGVIKSDRPKKALRPGERAYGEVCKGTPFYTPRVAAALCQYGNQVIIPITVRKEDMVAVSGNQAVAMQHHVGPHAWKQAMKNKL